MKMNSVERIQQEATLRNLRLSKKRCKELYVEWQENLLKAADQAELELIQEKLDQYWMDLEDSQLT